MKEYYVYIYLDPRHLSDHTILNKTYNNRIIYVGKGKDNRMYDHLKESSLINNNWKSNTLKSILKKIDLEEYMNNYIFKIADNLNNDEALKLELDVMQQIGTKYEIHPIIKKGTLLNATICGVPNPILFGKNNGMYGKSVTNILSENEIEQWKKSISEKLKSYWSNISIEDKIKHTEDTKVGLKRYWDELSTEEYNKRLDIIRKTFNGKHWTDFIEDSEVELKVKLAKDKFKATLANRSESENKIIKNKIGKGVKKYIEENGTYRDMWRREYGNKRADELIEESKKKMSKSTKKYFKNLSEEELSKWKSIWKNNSNNVRKFIDSLTDEEYKQWILNNRAGKNNPMYGQGDKLKGSKNGRAKKYILHMPNGERYYLHGTLKHFTNNVLKKIKPQPHRKYFNRILKEDIEIDGWYIKEIIDNDFDYTKNNYIKYEG